MCELEFSPKPRGQEHRCEMWGMPHPQKWLENWNTEQKTSDFPESRGPLGSDIGSKQLLGGGGGRGHLGGAAHRWYRDTAFVSPHPCWRGFFCDAAAGGGGWGVPQNPVSSSQTTLVPQAGLTGSFVGLLLLPPSGVNRSRLLMKSCSRQRLE